jgi:hypothetical protein
MSNSSNPSLNLEKRVKWYRMLAGLRKQSNVNSTGRGKNTKASLQHFLR